MKKLQQQFELCIFLNKHDTSTSINMILTNSLVTGCRTNANLTVCCIEKWLASTLKFPIVMPSISVRKNLEILFFWLIYNFPPYSQQFHKYLVNVPTWLRLPHLVHLVDGWSHHIWWRSHGILSSAVSLELSHTSVRCDIPKSWCHKLRVATSQETWRYIHCLRPSNRSDGFLIPPNLFHSVYKAIPPVLKK